MFGILLRFIKSLTHCFIPSFRIGVFFMLNRRQNLVGYSPAHIHRALMLQLFNTDTGQNIQCNLSEKMDYTNPSISTPSCIKCYHRTDALRLHSTYRYSIFQMCQLLAARNNLLKERKILSQEVEFLRKQWISKATPSVHVTPVDTASHASTDDVEEKCVTPDRSF